MGASSQLALQIVAWLSQHPQKPFQTRYLARSWGVSERALRYTLAWLVEQGEVQRETDAKPNAAARFFVGSSGGTKSGSGGTKSGSGGYSVSDLGSESRQIPPCPSCGRACACERVTGRPHAIRSMEKNSSMASMDQNFYAMAMEPCPDPASVRQAPDAGEGEARGPFAGLSPEQASELRWLSEQTAWRWPQHPSRDYYTRRVIGLGFTPETWASYLDAPHDVRGMDRPLRKVCEANRARRWLAEREQPVRAPAAREPAPQAAPAVLPALAATSPILPPREQAENARKLLDTLAASLGAPVQRRR